MEKNDERDAQQIRFDKKAPEGRICLLYPTLSATPKKPLALAHRVGAKPVSSSRLPGAQMGALRMARRGTNHFRLNDGRRAVRIARREGIEPSMIEIVGKDGVTFRVHGPKASSTPSEAEKEWLDAMTKLQKEKPVKSRSAPTRR